MMDEMELMEDQVNVTLHDQCRQTDRPMRLAEKLCVYLFIDLESMNFKYDQCHPNSII